MLYMLGKENIQPNCGPQMGLEDMGIGSWGGEYCLPGLGEVVTGYRARLVRGQAIGESELFFGGRGK